MVAGVLVDESFVLGGAEVTEGAVGPAGVVPAFDPVEDSSTQAGDGRPGLAVDELSFDGGKKTLSYCIVPAFPFAAERQDYPVFLGEVAKIMAGVLGNRGRSGKSPLSVAGVTRTPSTRRPRRARYACGRPAPSPLAGGWPGRSPWPFCGISAVMYKTGPRRAALPRSVTT